jgi:MFS family permease
MSESVKQSSSGQTLPKGWLSRGVLGIGLTSLFSDWSHEAATSILPAFLASLGAPAVALGIIEGVSDGLSSFAKLAGGFVADRPRWRKPAGIVGYLATALTTFGYAFARSWPMLLMLRGLGWMGRGSRGPARDTLLADCVAPGQQGHAFGFERAMDTLGAVLGPLSAMLLMLRGLGWMGRGSRGPARDTLLADCVAPGQQGHAFGFERAMDTLGAVLGPLSAMLLLGTLGLRGLLRWTLLPGLVALLSFVLLVPSAKRATSDASGSVSRSLGSSFTRLPRSFWFFLAGVFAHGLGDFAPTLLILRATQILGPGYGLGRAAAISVGLYTFHNLVDAAASYPTGALGDRFGKRGLLVTGYLIGTATYAGFVFAHPTLPVLIVLFGLAGMHDAFQQSLEKSLAAELLPKTVRGSGFGVLAAANGVGDLVSSVVVGALWSAVSPAAGFVYGGILAATGAAIIFRALPGRRNQRG